MSWDFLVIANPVWETARLVERIPGEPGASSPAGEPGAGSKVADGGGSALNTVCALAVAGRRVLAVGRVGDDEEGRASVEALRRRGVETACEILPGRTTKRNTCFVERETHATAFVVELPERSAPPWEDAPEALLLARVLLLDRLAAPAPAWLAARTQARDKRGRAASADIAPANALVRNSAILSPAGRDRLRSAMPHLGYLQVPEEPDVSAAAEVLPPQLSADDANPLNRSRIHRPRAHPPLSEEDVTAILDAGVRWLVRTRGARGIILHVAGRPAVHVPAVPTPVVDPTGAGDAFAAGFLDAVLDGEEPESASRRGVDWAARACRHLGARAWLDAEPPRRG